MEEELSKTLIIKDSLFQVLNNEGKKQLEEVIEKTKDTLDMLQNMRPLYIPAERIFFSMVGDSLAGLWANEINISK